MLLGVLRLVFEQNIFAYYYLALAVTLVLLQVAWGRILLTLVAWLIMVLLVFTEDTIIVWRQVWGRDARHWIPAIVIAVAALLILRSVRRHRVGWSVAMWGAVIVTALLKWPESSDPISHPLGAAWVWQVILVAIGTVLAAGPLVSESHHNILACLLPPNHPIRSSPCLPPHRPSCPVGEGRHEDAGEVDPVRPPPPVR